MNSNYLDVMRLAQRQPSGRLAGWCPLHYFRAACAMAGRPLAGNLPHQVIILKGHTMKRLLIELAQASVIAAMMFAAFIIYFWNLTP